MSRWKWSGESGEDVGDGELVLERGRDGDVGNGVRWWKWEVVGDGVGSWLMFGCMGLLALLVLRGLVGF